jgi:type II secretory pathway pseudopilin PulG
MFGISPTVMIALAVLATAALFLLTPLGRRKRKRPEKWEKAEIMRQLLALSEKETGARPAAPPARSRPAASRPAPTRPPMRPANLPIKANVKTTLPARSKAR